MAHEELKKQYEEDCKNYDRPWELWEMASIKKDDWVPLDTHPLWFPNLRYRRKKPPFQPEYYSGLNWRDAFPLVGKAVEFSDDGNHWTPGIFSKHSGAKNLTHRFLDERLNAWIYIRTTPETHAHPTVTLTVNGREWVLPMWETEPLERNVSYFRAIAKGKIIKYFWQNDKSDNTWLERGHIHRTESRAQAWADFWQDGILAQIRKSI